MASVNKSSHRESDLKFAHIWFGSLARFHRVDSPESWQFTDLDVMTPDEVSRLLAELSGVSLSMGRLLYGCGMRISECLRLRVKDIDFEQSDDRNS